MTTPMPISAADLQPLLLDESEFEFAAATASDGLRINLGRVRGQEGQAECERCAHAQQGVRRLPIAARRPIASHGGPRTQADIAPDRARASACSIRRSRALSAGSEVSANKASARSHKADASSDRRASWSAAAQLCSATA